MILYQKYSFSVPIRHRILRIIVFSICGFFENRSNKAVLLNHINSTVPVFCTLIPFDICSEQKIYTEYCLMIFY